MIETVGQWFSYQAEVMTEDEDVMTWVKHVKQPFKAMCLRYQAWIACEFKDQAQVFPLFLTYKPRYFFKL